MATKPYIQETLHEEIRTVTTNRANPAYSDIDRLSYLENFVKEVMRVYSPGEPFPPGTNKNHAIS